MGHGKQYDPMDRDLSQKSISGELTQQFDFIKVDIGQQPTVALYLDYLAYQNTREVADELDVSKKTVERDLGQKSISGELSQQFDFIKVDNVWRFQHPDSESLCSNRSFTMDSDTAATLLWAEPITAGTLVALTAYALLTRNMYASLAVIIIGVIFAFFMVTLHDAVVHAARY